MVRKCCSVCWNICWRCSIPDISWWHKQHTRKVRKSKCRLCSPCEEGLLVAGYLISLGLILSTSPWQQLLLLLSQHLFCPGNQFCIFLFLIFLPTSSGALITGSLLSLLASLVLWQAVRLGVLLLSLSSCLVFTVSHKHSPSWQLCVGLLLWWVPLLLVFLWTSFRILDLPFFCVGHSWSPPQSSRTLLRYWTRSWRGERDMFSCNNNKNL